MENYPRPNTNVTPENPNYSWWSRAEKERRDNARRWAKERLQRMRFRLSTLLAMSHGAVELSLRNEKSRRIRRQLRQDLEQRYGVKRPTYWP
jgi:hypothetical protein